MQECKNSLTGSCNFGTTMSNSKGWYKGFHMWLVKNGIANLLSMGLLEEKAYTIKYETGGEW